MTQAGFTFSTDDRSNRARVLEALQARRGQWVSGNTLRQVGGSRAPARVQELRDAGWLVECEGKAGKFSYRLTGWAEPPVRLTARGLAVLCAAWRAAL